RSTLTLRQRYGLSVVVQNILNLHRVDSDVQHVVLAIDGFTLTSDEDVPVLGKEDSFALARAVGEAEELEIDRRRRRYKPRASRVQSNPALFFRSQFLHDLRWGRRFGFGFENVA